MPTEPHFDARELRRVLGSFVTGVTVVTTIDHEGRAWGLTANSFSSVSLDPPLVLWSQATNAPSHQAFAAAERFAINILAEDQIGLSNRFATSGIDKFSGVEVDTGAGGVPLLRGCSAWLECTMASRLPGGDHVIFVGEVQAIRSNERRPLVFGSGQYLVADPHDLGKPPPGLGTTVQSQLHAARIGARAMARLSEEFDETMALSVWGNHGPTITAWQPSTRPVSASLPMGLALRVTSTATGLAMAAHLPAEATRWIVAPELAVNASGASFGPSDESEFEELLEEVRSQSIAIRTPGKFWGSDRLVNAMSVPVLDASGQTVIALTAIGAAERFPGASSELAEALKRTAADLSLRLGYRSGPIAQEQAQEPRGRVFTKEDENLLAQPLPECRTVSVRLPVYPGGEGIVEYRETGAADRPAVLLLHGIGSSSAGYRAQLAGLRDRYRLIAWNAPGFGRSTALANARPDRNAYVAAALALLKALGVTELAGLVGSSWGSVVAIALAQVCDMPVRALVLSAPNTARGIEQAAAQSEAARQAAINAGLASFHQDRTAIADRLLAANAPSSVREHTMRLRDAVTPQAWQQAMNMLFTVYAPQLLPDVAARVTIVVGTRDQVAPESAHAAVLRAARPSVEYVRLEGIGHMPKLEAPATFNRVIAASILRA